MKTFKATLSHSGSIIEFDVKAQDEESAAQELEDKAWWLIESESEVTVAFKLNDTPNQIQFFSGWVEFSKKIEFIKKGNEWDCKIRECFIDENKAMFPRDSQKIVQRHEINAHGIANEFGLKLGSSKVIEHFKQFIESVIDTQESFSFISYPCVFEETVNVTGKNYIPSVTGNA